jgi:hypothetical protein
LYFIYIFLREVLNKYIIIPAKSKITPPNIKEINTPKCSVNRTLSKNPPNVPTHKLPRDIKLKDIIKIPTTLPLNSSET